jgi:hypothetical protein
MLGRDNFTTADDVINSVINFEIPDDGNQEAIDKVIEELELFINKAKDIEKLPIPANDIIPYNSLSNVLILTLNTCRNMVASASDQDLIKHIIELVSGRITALKPVEQTILASATTEKIILPAKIKDDDIRDDLLNPKNIDKLILDAEADNNIESLAKALDKKYKILLRVHEVVGMSKEDYNKHLQKSHRSESYQFNIIKRHYNDVRRLTEAIGRINEKNRVDEKKPVVENKENDGVKDITKKGQGNISKKFNPKNSYTPAEIGFTIASLGMYAYLRNCVGMNTKLSAPSNIAKIVLAVILPPVAMITGVFSLFCPPLRVKENPENDNRQQDKSIKNKNKQ